MLFIRRWAYRPPQPPVARGLVQAPCVPPQKGGPVKLRFRGPPFTPREKAGSSWFIALVVMVSACWFDLPFPCLSLPFLPHKGVWGTLKACVRKHESMIQQKQAFTVPQFGVSRGPNGPLDRGPGWGAGAPQPWGSGKSRNKITAPFGRIPQKIQ